LLTALQQEASPEDRLAEMSVVVGNQSDAMIADCLTHIIVTQNTLDRF
jgi:hypothetical protein